MEPQAHILVASGSFAFWFESEPLLRRLELVLAEGLLEDLLIDGVELGADFSELGDWTRQLTRRKHPTLPGRLSLLSPTLQERILRLRHNTLHLAPLDQLRPSRCGWLIDRLQRVAETTGITEFTVHPDGVSEDVWRQLVENLPPPLSLSVENMDPRKKGFQSLEEMARLLDTYPSLQMTFDICHWMETGRAVDDRNLLQFLAKYGERISKLHFSVPRSQSEVYADLEEGTTTHFLSIGSGIWLPRAFFDALPSKIKWVAAGLVPLNGIRLLKSELYQLHRLAYQPAADRKVAVG